MKKILYLLLLVLAAGAARAQSISIFDVDTSSFPFMKAKIFALDAEGKQVRNINPSELALTENGVPREIVSISCPSVKIAQRISSTIVIDVSSSMNGQPLNIAKTVAKTWVNALPLGQSDCAIVSFNSSNYFNQDFTTNRNRLLTAIDGLTSGDGTDYNAALINPVAGGILTVKTAKYRKVIVFITDGQPNEQPNESAIISEALANGIMIHCITIGQHAPPSIVHFAQQTGGLLYEKVKTEEEAKNVALMLLGWSAYNYQPCELQWKDEVVCEGRSIEVILKWNSLTGRTTYSHYESSVSKLIFEPIGVRFINKPIGIKADTTISITAINADYNISGFVSSDNRFSITPPILTIPQGDTKAATLSFIPTDSSTCFSYINIQNNNCATNYYASSGYPNHKSKAHSLKLTSPNGGEEFLVGTDTLITWTGVLPEDIVKIEYSYDSGAMWNLITDDATGLKYVWKNVPKPESKKCLIRVISEGSDGKIEWEKTFRGIDDEYLMDVKETKDGYIAVGAWCKHIPGGYKNENIGVYYLDKQGVLIWKRMLGGNYHDLAYSVIETDDGGFLIGAITNSADILTPKGKFGDIDSWIIKLDIEGNMIWSKRYGGTKCDYLYSIVKTNDGGILAVGFSESNDEDITGNHGGEDAWIIKLDRGGNLIWQKSVGGNYGDQALSVIQTTDNCFVIAGLSRSNKGDISINKGESDCWIAKISSDGNLIWSKTFGGISSEALYSIKETKDHGFIVAGQSSSINGDIKNNHGGNDAIVAKLDANGNIQWIKLYGGSGWDHAKSIIETYDGDFIFVGESSSNDGDVQYAPKATGNYQFWMVKLDNTGQLKWSKILNKYSAGWASMGYANSVQQTSDDGFIVAGWINPDTQSNKDNLIIKCYPEQSSQSDVSDSVFSIAAPSIASRNIDMGRAILGAYKDSVFTSFIENKSKFECKIKDIRLTGADAADFYVISNKQFTLAGGEKKAIEFHFKPGALGTRNAQIEIESQDSILTQTITGEGVQPQIQLSTILIDFGVVEVNQSKDTVLFLVKNLDKDPITITDTKLLGPDFKQFHVVSGGGSFTLPSDSSQELKLAFNPVYIGRTSSDIGFYFNGAGSPARAQLFGQGIGGSVYCTEDSAAAGERVTINLCLRKVNVNSVNKMASSFEASIQYEKSALAPVNRSLLKSVGKDSAYLEIHGNIGKDSILYPIEFIAGLGANESTSIDIADFKWLDETGEEIEYETETQSGSFTLLGVCREGGARLFNPTGKAELLALAPNPAGEELTVTINHIEEGNPQIIIYNSIGEEMTRIAVDAESLGKKDINISLSAYPRGTYFVKYQTPTVSTGKVVILE